MGFCLTWQRNAEKGGAIPPTPNPLQCPHCGFVAKNAHSLKIHLSKAHR